MLHAAVRFGKHMSEGRDCAFAKVITKVKCLLRFWYV